MRAVPRSIVLGVLVAWVVAALPGMLSALVLRTRYLEAKPQVLKSADQPGGLVPLRLFSDTSYQAVLEDLDDHPLNGRVWRGRLVDHVNSLVVMVEHGDVLAGVVSTGERIFRVRFIGNGVHAIDEVDPLSLRSVIDDAVVPNLMARSFASTSSSHAPQGTSAGGTVLDVLMVYTKKAADILVKNPEKYWYVEERDWRRAIESQAMLSIAVANEALKNSRTKTEFRLVGVEKIKGKGSKDFGEDLDRLMDPTDGFADNVHELRDQYGADFVVLVLGRAAKNAGGRGFVSAANDPYAAHFAFSVVKSSYLWWTLVAHELGHNMGLVHNPEHDSIPARYRSHRYSRGYRDEAKGLATIMAYTEGCADCWLDIPHFSNPKVKWKGRSQPSNPRILQPECRGDEPGHLPDILFPVCGTRTGSKDAKAAKSIKRDRNRFAAFRQCRVDCAGVE